MGFNTSFMLLNDRVHELKDDPNIGKVLEEMTLDLSSPEHHRRHNFGYRGIRAIHCAHADSDQIIRVGQNGGDLLGLGYTLNPILRSAIKLAETTDKKERRKLIKIIEESAKQHKKYPINSNFTM